MKTLAMIEEAVQGKRSLDEVRTLAVTEGRNGVKWSPELFERHVAKVRARLQRPSPEAVTTPKAKASKTPTLTLKGERPKHPDCGKVYDTREVRLRVSTLDGTEAKDVNATLRLVQGAVKPRVEIACAGGSTRISVDAFERMKGGKATRAPFTDAEGRTFWGLIGLAK